MESALPLLERSIYEIYLESQETQIYTIPVYQRNYAWEEDEITALIKDVYDSFLKNEKAPYYIGTLVTYKRGDNVYEVIDGQQRLTTIYIILNALGIKEIRNKLTYTARKVSASTIQKLDNYPNLGDEVDEGIRNGYCYADKAIQTIVSTDEREKFEQYFLRCVHIIHYSVPKDVDLNHYFEVMNSRGEQLEKHEIVKSILSQNLADQAEMATFSRVWEACSEMNIYIQQAFTDVYGFDGKGPDFKFKSFDDIPKQEESEGKECILDLLEQPFSKIEDNSEMDKNDKFQSIIDFPNFLLIVLKITMMKRGDFDPAKFTLDDKELLNEFRDALGKIDDKGDFARTFIFNLLKAKFLLDNFIVHHTPGDKEMSADNPWRLQYYYEDSNQRKYPKNLDDDTVTQKEMVQLLSMFEVSFTPKQRKNYLFYCLMYLFDKYKSGVGEYLAFLQNLAKKYFYGVYLNSECLNERKQPKPNAFDDVILNEGKVDVEKVGCDDVDCRTRFEDIYKQGNADIPLFVFNYTDYVLWKKYADELMGKKRTKGDRERKEFFDKLGCSDFELDPFNNFYFSRTRKSLEHYYPQAKAVGNKFPNSYDINCFGNFAMIGAEANSSGSNWDPKTKLDHYSDGKSDPVSVASLKFKIMMQVCKDNNLRMMNGELDRDPGLEWNADDMKVHQEKMLDIIMNQGVGKS